MSVRCEPAAGPIPGSEICLRLVNPVGFDKARSTTVSKRTSCDDSWQVPHKKARPQRPGFVFLSECRCSVRSGRGELRDYALERLEGLLGKVGVKPCDLLRLGHEG